MYRVSNQWTISLPPILSSQALKLAKEESRTRSELVREALRYYLEERTMTRFRSKLNKTLSKMNINNENDVEQLIDEGRK